MKRIIRFLANISGVTNDIQIEERKRIGNILIDTHFWFVGNAYPFYRNIKECLYYIGSNLQQSIYTSPSTLRSHLSNSSSYQSERYRYEIGTTVKLDLPINKEIVKGVVTGYDNNPNYLEIQWGNLDLNKRTSRQREHIGNISPLNIDSP